MKLKELIILIIGMLFILLFVYASVSKWLHIEAFTNQMNAQPFDDKYTTFLVWSLPFTEIIVSLIIGHNILNTSKKPTGLFLATGMMIVFTIYIIAILIGTYKAIPCSCGGAIESLTWRQHLYFNVFFIVIGVVGIVFWKWVAIKSDSGNVKQVSLSN
jgi:uncharacterized membrane protein YphA (DoxX/SURF4 family)